MASRVLGSKWDQADVTDVDGDGDVDIVANNEEWWVEDDGELTTFDDPNLNPESMSVVWFENRLDEAPRRCQERAGVCELDAERPTRIGDGTWVERAHYPGAERGAYVQVFNGVNPVTECLLHRRPGECPSLADDDTITYAATRGMEYALDLEGGSYAVWARVLVPETFSTSLGGAQSDSAWIELGDRRMVVDAAGQPPGEWVWVRADRRVQLDDGRHVLSLRARERGFAVDAILITSDRDFQPQ
jgi:hypothetical protein